MYSRTTILKSVQEGKNVHTRQCLRIGVETTVTKLSESNSKHLTLKQSHAPREFQVQCHIRLHKSQPRDRISL